MANDRRDRRRGSVSAIGSGSPSGIPAQSTTRASTPRRANQSTPARTTARPTTTRRAATPAASPMRSATPARASSAKLKHQAGLGVRGQAKMAARSSSGGPSSSLSENEGDDNSHLFTSSYVDGVPTNNPDAGRARTDPVRLQRQHLLDLSTKARKVTQDKKKRDPIKKRDPKKTTRPDNRAHKTDKSHDSSPKVRDKDVLRCKARPENNKPITGGGGGGGEPKRRFVPWCS